MKEEYLHFERNEDKTIVSLKNSEVQELGEVIHRVIHTHKDFIERYDKGEINAKTLAKFEADLEQIMLYFKYDQVRAADAQDSQQRAVWKQQENDKLRKQLTIPPTSEDVRERIKLLCNELNLWWDVVGLGHTKFNFTTKSLILDASGNVFGGYDMEGNRVEKDEKLAILKEQGFEFDTHKHLLLNKNNTNLLTTLITETFPNADIRKIRNMNYGGEFIIQDIEIEIPYVDLVDFRFTTKPKPETGSYSHRHLKTEREKVQHSLKELGFSLVTLVEYYNKGELEVGFSQTVLSCIQSYSEDLFSLFNYKGLFHQYTEAESGAIRAANIENRALREQLGRKVSNSSFSDTFKELNKKLKEWWESQIGYIQTDSIRFHEYGMVAILSCTITDYYDGGDSYSDQDERIEKLKDIGVDVDTRTSKLSDTETNRAYLKNMLNMRFGHDNYVIDSVKTDWVNLHEIAITIRNLDVI